MPKRHAALHTSHRHKILRETDPKITTACDIGWLLKERDDVRILVAPERFYPSMKAQAVAQAMVRGLQQVLSPSDFVLYPLASGGSGTTDLAVRLAEGRLYHEVIAVGSRRRREVKWGWLPDHTAIFDAQDALGNPDGPSQLPGTYTDSRPVGEMLRRLIARRPERIAIALGDVLAADGGMGILQAFGVTLMDDAGTPLAAGSRPLLAVDRIDFSGLTPPPVPIVGLTDHWSSWNERVQQRDFRLDLIHGGLTQASCRFAELLSDYIRVPLGDVAASGAGGGLGMALAFLGAQFKLGAEYLAHLGKLEEKAWRVDWAVTGSTQLSADSCNQAVGMVAQAAQKAGIPAVALTLQLGPGHGGLYDAGIVGQYSVLDRPRSEREVHRALASLIEKAAYRVGYWMQALSDP
jgi:glycerate kinase